MKNAAKTYTLSETLAAVAFARAATVEKNGADEIAIRTVWAAQAVAGCKEAREMADKIFAGTDFDNMTQTAEARSLNLEYRKLFRVAA